MKKILRKKLGRGPVIIMMTILAKNHFYKPGK